MKGTSSNLVVSVLFSSFFRFPTERVNSTSLNLPMSSDSLFQALNFFGVKMVESFTPITMRFPSSPKCFKNTSYSRFTGWSSGRRFASVKVKRMFFHCIARSTVIRAMTTKIPVRFLRINRATTPQKPILKSLFKAVFYRIGKGKDSR